MSTAAVGPEARKFISGRPSSLTRVSKHRHAASNGPNKVNQQQAPPSLVERTLAMVKLRLESREWDAARAAIDRMQREEGEVVVLPVSGEARLNMALGEIGLTIRTLNAIESIGVRKVGELLQCTPDELLAIPNFGPLALNEVYSCLEKIGFKRPSEAITGMTVTGESRFEELVAQ